MTAAASGVDIAGMMVVINAYAPISKHDSREHRVLRSNVSGPVVADIRWGRRRVYMVNRRRRRRGGRGGGKGKLACLVNNNRENDGGHDEQNGGRGARGWWW